MELNKVMKRGLSLVLSAAMVLAGAPDITAKAADDAHTVEIGNVVIEQGSPTEVGVPVTVKDATDSNGVTDGTLSFAQVDGNGKEVNNDDIKVTLDDVTSFTNGEATATVNNPGDIELGSYKVKATYTNQAGSDTGSTTFTVDVKKSYEVSFETPVWAKDGKKYLAKNTADISGALVNYKGEAAASKEITFTTDNNKVTVADATTNNDGEFTATATVADDLVKPAIVKITATYTDDASKKYTADVYMVQVPDSGAYMEMQYSRHGEWSDYGPWFNGIKLYADGTGEVNNSTQQDNVSKNYQAVDMNATEDKTYELEINFKDLRKGSGDATTFFYGLWMQIGNWGDAVTYTAEDAARVSLTGAKLNDTTLTLDETFAKDDSGNVTERKNTEAFVEDGNIKIALSGAWFGGNDALGNLGLTDTVNSEQKLVVTIKVAGKTEVTPNPGDDKTEETKVTAATVTAVSMNPANITTKAAATTSTVGAVVEVKGQYIGLVKKGDVKVTAPTLGGVGKPVDAVVTTAASVTSKAASATFSAVFTVPANVATGVYTVKATVSTKAGAAAYTATVGSITITPATVAATSGGTEPTPTPAAKATKSIKLAVKKATIGVKETVKIKVTAKKKAGATAAQKITVSKNSKKAVVSAKISKKNLVLKGKKAGKATITVKSGKKTAKITVTVKKAPKKVSLKDGKKAAKKTVSLKAKTKKKAVAKTYKIQLPKNTASYGYTVKKSGKKSIIKKVAVNSAKQTITVTVKKGAKGSAKLVVSANANKKAKATIKVKASK